MWIIGHDGRGGGTALAEFMYSLLTGVHKRIDDVRGDLSRLHDDHTGSKNGSSWPDHLGHMAVRRLERVR